MHFTPQHWRKQALTHVLEPEWMASHRGQIAVYCNAKLTVYAYSKDKKGRHMADFLRIGKSNSYRGRLVADAAKVLAVRGE